MLSRDVAAKYFIFCEVLSVIFLLAPPTSAPTFDADATFAF
jgi:hypothetical protein